MSMANAKAQVLEVTDRGITVSVIGGPWRNNHYAGMPQRDEVQEGQFVDLYVHPSGQRAEWPSVG